MRGERLRDILPSGLFVLALAMGCGSEKNAEESLGLPNCPATTGTCSFTWTGASSGTLPCTVSVTLRAPYYWGDLSLLDTTPLVWPDAHAGFELKAAPTAGSVIREGDLANFTASSVVVLENGGLGWFCYRENNPASRTGDFALYIESVNATELHGHLSALLGNLYGAPGTFVQVCATF
jgi:hypothetical protein